MQKKLLKKTFVVASLMFMALVVTIYAQQLSMTRLERVRTGMAGVADPAAPEPQSYPVAVAVIRNPGNAAALSKGRVVQAMFQDVNPDVVASDTAADAIATYDATAVVASANHPGLVNTSFFAGGRTLGRFGHSGTLPGEFKDPHGLAGDDSGNIYVADTGNDRVQKLTHKGQPIMQVGTKGSGNGQLKSPYGVVVERDGSILVADTGNHRVERFSRTGEFLLAWGSQGSQPGQFFYPQALTVDRLGNVYVADFGNHRIQKFTKDGKFVTTWGQLGSRPGQFNYPSSLAIDARDHLWVTDLLNHRLQAFTLSGELVGTYGTYSANAAAPNEFNHPRGIAIEPNGDIWIAHPGVHSIDHLRINPTALARVEQR